MSARRDHREPVSRTTSGVALGLRTADDRTRKPTYVDGGSVERRRAYGVDAPGAPGALWLGGGGPGRRGSAGVVREEAGEGTDRAVLEGLDRALVLAHDPGGLGDGEALQEAERDALLLLGVEAAYGLEEGGVGEGLQDGVLGERSTSLASSISPVVISRRNRLDLKWSATRLRAIVTSQAPKSRPCQVNVPMRRRARRNVSLVRSSAVALPPTR